MLLINMERKIALVYLKIFWLKSQNSYLNLLSPETIKIQILTKN
jgi:hypothetical protein